MKAIVVTPMLVIEPADFIAIGNRLLSALENGATWIVAIPPNGQLPDEAVEFPNVHAFPCFTPSVASLMLNYWIAMNCQRGGDRYIHILLPDDLVPPDFYAQVSAKYAGSAVYPWPSAIVTSMLRGDNAPPGEEIYPLVAKPSEMEAGKVEIQQAIIRESTLFRHRFDPFDKDSGGKLAEAVCKRSGSILFAPELVVFKGALQPGRWNSIPVEAPTTRPGE